MNRPSTTAFQDRVYRVLSTVPTGRVTTYGRLAQAVGSSARAVGQALRKNPFAPEVPCHRVISADLTIGGFDGATSGQRIADKLSILWSEGVRFTQGHLADPGRLYDFGAAPDTSQNP